MAEIISGICCMNDKDIESLCDAAINIVDKRVARGCLAYNTGKNYKSAVRQFRQWAESNSSKYDEFYVLIREWEQRAFGVGDNIDNYRFVGRLILMIADVRSLGNV